MAFAFLQKNPDYGTRGTWQPRLGVDGYYIAGLTPTYDASIQNLSVTGTPVTLANPVPSGALNAFHVRNPITGSGIVSHWEHPSGITVNMDIAATQGHLVDFYLYHPSGLFYWNVKVRDRDTGFELHERNVNLSSAQSGVHVQYNCQGNLSFTFTRRDASPIGYPAVVSAMFFNQVQGQGLPLYLTGPRTNSNSVNLYTFGKGFDTAGMNLFVKSDVYPVGKGINLNLTGSTSGYTYDYNMLPLYVQGEVYGVGMNLFTTGWDTPKPVSAGMNLFAGGYGTQTTGTLDLVIWGNSVGLGDVADDYDTMTQDQFDTLGIETYDVLMRGQIGGYHVNNSLSLYTKGEGLYNNFIPASAGLNLLIQTAPGAEDSLNLFLSGSPASSTGLDLFAKGVTGYTSNSVPLYTKGWGQTTRSLPLFARGYNDGTQLLLSFMDTNSLHNMSTDSLYSLGL